MCVICSILLHSLLIEITEDVTHQHLALVSRLLLILSIASSCTPLFTFTRNYTKASHIC